MATLYGPTENIWVDSTNEALDDNETTITLSDTTGLPTAGIVTIDRKTSAGVETPSLREDVSYTGISSNDLTGCTRGVNNTTAQEHDSGAVVEAVFTPKHWNDFLTVYGVAHNTNGTQIKGINTEADAATVTFDLDDGLIHQVEITDDRTFAISNETAGQVFMLRVIQGTGGSHTPTWFSTIKWEDGNEPELSTAEGDVDVFTFIVTGTDAYDGFHAGTQVS